MMTNITAVNETIQTTWITACYRSAFPAVARYISRRGGTLDEAADVFQDSLIILYEKKVENNLPHGVNETAYLAGIAKNLWKQHCKKNSLTERLGGNIENMAVNETEPETAGAKLLHLLETGGQRCLDLLKAFYYDKLSPEKAAARFGYAGVRSVTVQKYKCLEKIRNEVKTKTLAYADFLE